MAPKRKAELMRESRKRKRDNELRYSDEFFQFIRDTPFSSNITTDSEKFEAFLRLRNSNAPKPASNAEKCKKYREVDKLRKREVDKLRKRDARLKKKLKIVFYRHNEQLESREYISYFIVHTVLHYPSLKAL